MAKRQPIPRYKRVILKLSGEALKGDLTFGISGDVIDKIAKEVKQIHDLGIEIGIVVGGGNYFRGDRSNNFGVDRASADYIGMVATIMNGIALRDTLERNGLEVQLVSALQIPAVAETFVRQKVLKHLQNDTVVIFSAGTGNPFFTTDTAAALRGIEINADVLLKATLVDGVYSADPKKVKDSVKFDKISYDEVISKELKVMDLTAVLLCKDNNLPIKIFDLTYPGNIIKVLTEEHIGTLIC